MNDEEKFVNQYVEAIRNGTFHEQKLVLTDYLTPFAISERCAILGVNFASIPSECRRASAYALGCVAVDNLEEFLKFEREIGYPPEALVYAGKHCSCKVMQHYGFTPDQLYLYIDGAILGRNKETLRFLLPYQYVQSEWYYCLRKKDPSFDFVVECYREGLLTLSELAWSQMKENNTHLYDALREDV